MNEKKKIANKQDLTPFVVVHSHRLSVPELCTKTRRSCLRFIAVDTSFVFRRGPGLDLKLEGDDSFPLQLMRLTGDLAGFITTIEDFAVLIVNEVLVAHLVFSIL